MTSAAQIEMARRIAASRTPEEWRADAERHRKYGAECALRAKRLRRDAEANERAAEQATAKARELEGWAELAEKVEVANG